MNFKTIFLGLGSNIGNLKKNLDFALKKLALKINILKVSHFYKTAPLGPKQEDFLNCVLQGTTFLTPEELLFFVKEIEAISGRIPSFFWGPRILDIDILMVENIFCQTPQLTLPHPKIIERRFVLEPLFEIIGNVFLPQKKTLLFYLNQCLEQPCEKVDF